MGLHPPGYDIRHTEGDPPVRPRTRVGRMAVSIPAVLLALRDAHSERIARMVAGATGCLYLCSNMLDIKYI